MSKYTEKLFTALHAVKKPVDFKVDLVEDEYNLILRVYEPDIMRLGEKDRKVVMEYLLELRAIINRHGVRGLIQPVKDYPPQ